MSVNGLMTNLGDLSQASIRTDDVRIVAHWISGQFYSGFLKPLVGTPVLEGASSQPVTGQNYFDKAFTNAWGIWFHGFGQTNPGRTSVEAFTVDTDIRTMSNDTYMFYVRTSNVNVGMSKYVGTAELEVDVYLPENRGGKQYYNLFSKPYRTYKLKDAQKSLGNEQGAGYWHVFDLVRSDKAQNVKDRLRDVTEYNPVNQKFSSYENGRVVTGPQDF